MKLIIAFILSYLIGSIPTAYILIKTFKGIDIRKVGSGNPGTTNALRSGGIFLGITTFVFDFLKGFIPVLIAKQHFTTHIVALIMLFAVLGHITSIFLSFKGGKGVATFLGTLFAFSFKLALITLLIFLIVFILTHIVSISSIIATLFLITISIVSKNFNIYTKLLLTITGILIIYRHNSNIRRVLNKEEKKLF